MSTALIRLQTPEAPWSFRDEPIIVGKDILEVLSSAMYVDPLAIYREYIQNSSDAIDDARRTGLLEPTENGTVEIDLDVNKRIVKIRDNGTGVSSTEFEPRMTSFGASAKRGTNARGFRGVGRLSGLAYCQELVFRARAAGEAQVTELRWDCRKAKVLLRSSDFSGDLADVVAQCVQVRRVDGKNWPKHFFEVELRGVPRLRNDWLLNPTVIEEYLSQVAPLPFAPHFRFADDIAAMLRGNIGLTDVRLTVAGNTAPTFRPHRDSFEISGGTDTFQELQTVKIPAYDGNGIAAIGWILHHSYKGAVPSTTLKGLRLRSGNIQVGTSGILEDLFVETRFNSWCVGEIHVIDSRIIPNGRRDHYEQNVHYTNLINQLSPIARDISTRCRQSSLRRNWLRQFERQRDQARHGLDIVKQGSLTGVQRQVVISQVQLLIDTMNKALLKEFLKADAPAMTEVLSKLRRDFLKIKSGQDYQAKALSRLAPVQRRAYQQVFSLLYECSSDGVAAKTLIDRMLLRIAQGRTKRSR
jgi:Histidine kinase-, DNA gyrase B-, and HSP90-like ATPase